MIFLRKLCSKQKNQLVCPVETTVNLIGAKWKILIMRDLLQGPHRFNELKKVFRELVKKS